MCKFLIVGDSAVGKTNLLLRFCDDTYTENHITTIGIDFKFKEMDILGHKMKI
jgi:GTPase SAR1 family protein